jgi:hypothetical protein
MLNCSVKFCGGCNPRYDRGAAYRKIIDECRDIAQFEVASEGRKYDILLIIRGCTQCPYLYEEIDAEERIICTSEEEVDLAIRLIKKRSK